MNNYEVLGVIGQGQYGTAYKAQHRLDGQLYCIKRITLSSKEDQSGVLKEVQLLSQLDHPNIIAYKESFIDQKDGALCIVTSFCEEGDLFTRIRKRQQANQLFSEQEVMDMFVQIASALMHIHGKRILHRDLKTQNIFIARGNIIKLGDFGISKVLEKTDQFATTVTGTPYYMAPEICTNQPYTFKSDIWSLGCVLYELCTLKHAFAADSLLSLVYQIVRGNFPPISSTQFSPGLSTLVNSLLVREAPQRPSLTQILQMPYVMQNLQRYSAESQRTLTKHSHTMARKRQLLEKTAAATTGQDDANLTPKQRMAKNKEAERQRRELELQLANMNMQKDRGIAAQRKAANIQGSKAHGLPGSSPSRPGQAAVIDYQDYQPQLDDSLVNLGTVAVTSMPGIGSTMRPPSSLAQHSDYKQAYTESALERTAYNAYDNRPATSSRPSTRQPEQHSMYPVADDEDSVLLGTVAYGGTMAGQRTAMAGQLTTAAMHSPVKGLTNLHVSEPSNNSMRVQIPGSPTPALPSNIVGGFKFGLTNSGAMPALPPFPSPSGPNAAIAGSRPMTPISPPMSRTPSPPPSAKIKFGISSDSQPRGSFEYVIKSAKSASSYDNEDLSEGPGEYESDFEDYTPDDQDTINTRCKILSNLQDLERSTGAAPAVDYNTTQESVSADTKNSKAAAMRQRCQASLGFHFPQVYAYLRRVRTQDAASDEARVQRELYDLVGGDRTLLQGCFLVDQLVFQEMMYNRI